MSTPETGMIVSVGQRAPAPFDGIEQNGAILQMDNEGILIGAMVDNPTPAEVKVARESKMTIGLLQHKDALFFMIALGNALIYDLPFDVTKVDAKFRGLPHRDHDAGLTFSLIFGDSVSKKIKALRFATTTPQFSKILETMVAKMEARMEKGVYDFNTSVQEAFAKYPDPARMFADSLIVEQAGRPFTDIDRSMERSI